MYGYRYVLFLAGVLLLFGIGYAAFSSEPVAAQPAVVAGDAIRMESDLDRRISAWAAEQGLEYVPAPRASGAEVVVLPDSGQRGEIQAPAGSPQVEVLHGSDRGGVTVVGEGEEGVPQIIYESRGDQSNRRRNRIDSIDDLSSLSERDLRELREEDVDVRRLRDDVNGGLRSLGRRIRGINQSYYVSGVRNASGTAATGGSGYERQ